MKPLLSFSFIDVCLLFPWVADAGGRVHASAERVGNSVSLATAHCPPGYYILSITVGAETRSVKFPVGL